MSPNTALGKGPRERLLETADRLFYAEGVQTVGIDRIIEVAGVAKSSLYKLFGSKEGLILAYLQHRHDGTVERLTEALSEVHEPDAKILAVFDVQARTFAEPDFNGCAFMEASAEVERGSVIALAATEFRTWIRTMFVDLAREAGAEQPEHLGAQLHVLYDGAIVAARMDHDPLIAATTRAAAASLLTGSVDGHR